MSDSEQHIRIKLKNCDMGGTTTAELLPRKEGSVWYVKLDTGESGFGVEHEYRIAAEYIALGKALGFYSIDVVVSPPQRSRQNEKQKEG